MTTLLSSSISIPQFADRVTEETQTGKVTWKTLHSRSGAEVEKVSTADTQAGPLDFSPLGHKDHAQQNTPQATTICSHDSGERTAHLSVPRSMWFEASFFLIFFLPPFCGQILGWLEGKHSGISGVSLLFHYISESLQPGEWNAKQGHLTSSLALPRGSAGLPQSPLVVSSCLWGQAVETSGKYPFSEFLI